MNESKTFWDSVRKNRFLKWLRRLLNLFFILGSAGISFTIWHLVKPDQFDHYITEHVHPDKRKSKK